MKICYSHSAQRETFVNLTNVEQHVLPQNFSVWVFRKLKYYLGTRFTEIRKKNYIESSKRLESHDQEHKVSVSLSYP